MSKIILISGTTASGKSEFAVKLAKKINGEIINADSMQIYKEIKILNTRPEKSLTNKVKHQHAQGDVVFQISDPPKAAATRNPLFKNKKVRKTMID